MKGHFQKYKKDVMFFFVMALSASLPLMITREQRTFYLVPSFPFFAMTMAILSFPAIHHISQVIEKNKKRQKQLQVSAFMLLVFALIFAIGQIGKTSRDKDILNDIYTIGPLIPEAEIIAVDTQTWFKYNVHSYFIRHYYISLGTKTNTNYLIFSKDKKAEVPSAYRYIPLETKVFDFYERNSE